jgi:hypothetical protein
MGTNNCYLAKLATNLSLLCLGLTLVIISSAVQAEEDRVAGEQNGLGTEWESWGAWFITEDRWIETIHTSFPSSPISNDRGQ